MRYFVYIFWLIVIILAIIFVALNSHSVELNYYMGTSKIYLPLLLFLGLLLGAILGVFAIMPALFSSKRQKRKLKKRIRQIEQELQNLRNIPIKDTH